MRLLVAAYLFTIASSVLASGLNEANSLFQDNKVKESILKYEEYLKNNNDISGYYNLGIAYHKNNEHGKAIWAFEKVLKENPNDEAAYNQIVACQHDIDPTNNWNPILGSIASNLYSYSIDFWSYCAIFFSIILGFIIIKFSKSHAKGYLVITGIIALIGIAGSIYIAESNLQFSLDQYGIAVVESTLLEKNNGKFVATKKLMLEGSRVRITENINGEYLSVIDESGDQQFVHKSAIRSF